MTMTDKQVAGKPVARDLGIITEGELVLINGREFWVDSVHHDVEGSKQITFLTRSSQYAEKYEGN